MKRPAEDFYIYRRHLPHFRSRGRTYFVTWRVGVGQPDLQPDERSEVVSSLKHFDGTRYELIGYVVMNDHAHVLVCPEDGYKLEDITHAWKSYSAHRSVEIHGRRAPVWQHESFDRIVRNEVELHEKMQYIVNNPFKRWPDLDSYKWVWCRGME